ncbi:MAG: RlmE family RNA methyltransferase [Deltaproteobacteria bacterium]|nr:RlmE family RNA methyltransferase [Deltaproteobacteria bacterium]
MSNYHRAQDHFGRRAKKEGKAARSIYKLEEMDARWRLLGAGDVVLDLGCAPGSWMQYAATKVGPKGRVLGYDLKPISVSLPAHAEARVGDAFAIPDALLPEKVDVVLSDMAPNTIGDHGTDAARSAALAERALDIAERILAPGGNFVVKVLEGRDLPEIVRQMRKRFAKVEQLRPEATRKRSTEIFLVGLSKVGAPT